MLKTINEKSCAKKNKYVKRRTKAFCIVVLSQNLHRLRKMALEKGERALISGGRIVQAKNPRRETQWGRGGRIKKGFPKASTKLSHRSSFGQKKIYTRNRIGGNAQEEENSGGEALKSG